MSRKPNYITVNIFTFLFRINFIRIAYPQLFYNKEKITVPFVLTVLLSESSRRIYVDLYCVTLNCGAVHLISGYSFFSEKTHSLIPEAQILSRRKTHTRLSGQPKYKSSPPRIFTFS